MSACLRIHSPGLQTSIQDLGRPGYARYGVPAGGAVDPFALRAANAIVGNAPDCGALEMHYVGPTFEVEAESVRVAFFGARASIEVFDGPQANNDGRTVAAGQSLRLRRGQIVRVGSFNDSAILYMSIEGGFAVEPVMGSVSTYLRGGFGGFEGRQLREADALSLNLGAVSDRVDCFMSDFRVARENRVRVIDGPQVDHFEGNAIETFYAGEYKIAAGSDRMGMRLEGEKLASALGFNIVSDGIVPGSIQVTGEGQPIVLMRDHQTTGGYPKIATVISADISALGRKAIGSTIIFERVSMAAAVLANRAMTAEISEIAAHVRPIQASGVDLNAILGASNLISGFVCAFG